MKKPKYPEHEKLKLVQEHSNIIGQFLDWLSYERGYKICECCEGADARNDDSYYPVNSTTEKILADYYGINLDKLENEKRQMLDLLRKQNRKNK